MKVRLRRVIFAETKVKKKKTVAIIYTCARERKRDAQDTRRTIIVVRPERHFACAAFVLRNGAVKRAMRRKRRERP